MDAIKTLLETAKSLYSAVVSIDPITGAYVTSRSACPAAHSPFDGPVEPLVPAPGFNMGEAAHCSLNHYNSLVLNTNNMFIVDIDFADRRHNKWTGAASIQDVLDTLHDLGVLDQQAADRAAFRWSDQCWRVYRTHSGARVICTSRPVPFASSRYEVMNLFRFLGADPNYARLCCDQLCYRARLTPKPWRVAERFVAYHVTTLWADTIHDDIKEQLRLHDQVTEYQSSVNQKVHDNDDAILHIEPATFEIEEPSPAT